MTKELTMGGRLGALKQLALKVGQGLDGEGAVLQILACCSSFQVSGLGRSGLSQHAD